MSVAVAVIVTNEPGKTATPSAGDVIFTTGGGFVSTLVPPVTMSE
jgi:hypothetical protein